MEGSRSGGVEICLSQSHIANKQANTATNKKLTNSTYFLDQPR